jgi:hypothetical protein
MSELPPDEPSIARADAGGRKAVAHDAHGVQTSAVTSPAAVTTISVRRIHYLAQCIHLFRECCCDLSGRRG